MCENYMFQDDRPHHSGIGEAVPRFQRDVQHSRRRRQHPASQGDKMKIKEFHFIINETGGNIVSFQLT